MSDYVSIQVSGDIEKIKKELESLPPALANVGTEAAAKYLLNKLINDVPPQKHITRRQAYGVPFFSEKQRRYFFAVVAKTLPYQRGGKVSGMQTQWEMLGGGWEVKLNNRAPGSLYVFDNQRQARLNALVGWKKVSQYIKEYQPQMLRSFKNAVRNEIKRRGLSSGG